MIKTKRTAKSYTLDSSVVSYVLETQGSSSASERVNRLLKRAIVEERYEALEREAAVFFSTKHVEERRERSAFRKATLKSITRD